MAVSGVKKNLYALSLEELKKVIYAALNANDCKGYMEFIRVRNAIMIAFSATLGLRPRECYNAKLEYLDIKTQNFYIPAEANKQRFADDVYVPCFMIEKLQAYLTLKQKYMPDSKWLFPSRSKHGRLDRSDYGKMFRAAVKAAGLYEVAYIDPLGLKRGKITPYSLRATFATQAWNKLHDFKQVAILLRHRDPLMRTTHKYVRITDTDVRADIIKRLYDEDTVNSFELG